MQSDRIAAKLTATVEKAAKALILAICANLIKATPVDTGWAKANWIPSIGEPVLVPAGSRDAVSTAAQQAGQAEVLRYRLGDGPLWIGNFVDYIRFLNYGTSAKAPAGFVEVAIATGMATVKAKFSVDFGLEEFVNEQGGEAAEGLAEAFSPFGGEA